jgi:hypothetical protein
MSTNNTRPNKALSLYANYNCDTIINGKKLGGLNSQQEFRSQPQETGSAVQISVVLQTDLSGILYIDYTNIVHEPYEVIELTTFNVSDLSTYPLLPLLNGQNFYTQYIASTVKGPYFRVRFKNTTQCKQKIFRLTTFLFDTITEFKTNVLIPKMDNTPTPPTPPTPPVPPTPPEPPAGYPQITTVTGCISPQNIKDPNYKWYGHKFAISDITNYPSQSINNATPTPATDALAFISVSATQTINAPATQAVYTNFTVTQYPSTNCGYISANTNYATFCSDSYDGKSAPSIFFKINNANYRAPRIKNYGTNTNTITSATEASTWLAANNTDTNNVFKKYFINYTGEYDSAGYPLATIISTTGPLDTSCGYQQSSTQLALCIFKNQITNPPTKVSQNNIQSNQDLTLNLFQQNGTNYILSDKVGSYFTQTITYDNRNPPVYTYGTYNSIYPSPLCSWIGNGQVAEFCSNPDGTLPSSPAFPANTVLRINNQDQTTFIQPTAGFQRFIYKYTGSYTDTTNSANAIMINTEQSTGNNPVCGYVRTPSFIFSIIPGTPRYLQSETIPIPSGASTLNINLTIERASAAQTTLYVYLILKSTSVASNEFGTAKNKFSLRFTSSAINSTINVTMNSQTNLNFPNFNLYSGLYVRGNYVTQNSDTGNPVTRFRTTSCVFYDSNVNQIPISQQNGQPITYTSSNTPEPL